MLSLETDEVLKTFQSMQQAVDFLIENGYTQNKSAGVRIKLVCESEPNEFYKYKAYGFGWKYIDKV